MYDIVLEQPVCLDIIIKKSVLPYFSDIVIDFIAELAQAIQKSAIFHDNPEMLAMAFWMRRAHLLAFKEKYRETDSNVIRVGHGTVFHVAPANVDSIFFYSWFISLLSGNKNIVRLSRKTIGNITPFLKILNQKMMEPKYKKIAERNLLVTYDHSDETTSLFSQHCQMRVIWGGDETIKQIRKLPIPPASKELTFPNRFSLSIINTDSYLNIDEKGKNELIKKFYNDAYWFGQQACSSPRLVCWIGSRKETAIAQTDFWSRLEAWIKLKDHNISLADVSAKIFAMQAIAMQNMGNPVVDDLSQLVSRLHLNTLQQLPKNWHCGGGLFFEYVSDDLLPIFESLEPDVQTISYFGFDVLELQRNYLNSLPPGGARIVPLGQSLNFDEIWDGHLLFSEFSKRVVFL